VAILNSIHVYFLLVVHRDYIVIWYRFGDISTCMAHMTTCDLQCLLSIMVKNVTYTAHLQI